MPLFKTFMLDKRLSVSFTTLQPSLKLSYNGLSFETSLGFFSECIHHLHSNREGVEVDEALSNQECVKCFNFLSRMRYEIAELSFSFLFRKCSICFC